MKYPQLVSTPAVVKEWLEAELECLGIDSAAYARTVLSLLSRDSIDPAEVIQSGYVLVANKGGRGAGGPSGPHPPRTREEELKRAEVIECLRSASEDHGGIQLLVDQLISMLKQLPAASEPAADTVADTSRRPAAADPPPSDDPVLRYEAAFPALSRESPSVIPLTFFSKMGRTAAKVPAAELWRADLVTTAVWPTPLDLSLLLAPPAYTAPLEPPPPPKPPEPAEAARTIRPSAETHFQPIRRASGDDQSEEGPAAWPPPATYDARLYTRSESGGLYLEDEQSRPSAEPPQKYMIYREEAPPVGRRRGLAPKFKLSCNEKYCQTDEAAPADGAGRDLLQILVSGEQAGAVRGVPADDDEDDDDADSSYEVLSSLQQTLHSIYEDGSETADSGAEPEPEPLPADPPPEPEPEPERRPSAFARVLRPPAGHRPLYLRGGGADSLLAAVYTGGAWSPADSPAEPADHRPLYARQPAGGGVSEFAEHRQLSSGRISGTVYRQGPTEYPALRYQLAGRDLPEVTFCRLSGDTHRSGPLKEEPAAGWEGSSDVVRSSREASVGSDAGAWLIGDGTLWQAAGERDRSADRALWEARAEPGQRRGSEEPEPAALWEPPRSLVEGTAEGAALWEPPRGLPEPEPAAEHALWEPRDSRTERESSVEMTIWSTAGETAEREEAANTNIWQAGAGPVSQEKSAGGTLWTSRELTQREVSIDETLWESRDDLSQQERSIEEAVWEARGGDVIREPAVDRRWELRQEPVDRSLWGSPTDLYRRDGSVEKTVWEPRDRSVEKAIWESPGDLSPRAEPPEKAPWEVSIEPPEKASWEISRELPEKASWEVSVEPPERASWEVAMELPEKASWEMSTEPTEKASWKMSTEPPEKAPWEMSTEPSKKAPWEVSIESQEKAPWEVSIEPSEKAPWEISIEPPEKAPWEVSIEPPEKSWEAEEAAGWPLIRAPEHIWRRGEPAWSGVLPANEADRREEVRRLLWRLGEDHVLAQTGLYSADDLTDAGRNWEFIDENNVKNKIDASCGDDGGPLASELAAGGWRLLPALRQLSESLGLAEGRPLPDGVALQAWTLEEQWRRDDGPPRPARERRARRSDRKRPCSYFMEGSCKRNDCKFSHDLSAITCVFWEESGCFKGAHCPFLHGYPADDEEDEDSSDSAKRAVPKKSFKLEKEDFPSLHNVKKWHRNDEEDNRKAGRRNCRRHKSFSDATIGVGGGDSDLPRPALGSRGKRRRHHSKSEGVRPADTGARRP